MTCGHVPCSSAAESVAGRTGVHLVRRAIAVPVAFVRDSLVLASIVGRVDQAHDPHAAIEPFVEGGMVAVAQGHPLGFAYLQRLDRVRTGQERISFPARAATQRFQGLAGVGQNGTASGREKWCKYVD